METTVIMIALAMCIFTIGVIAIVPLDRPDKKRKREIKRMDKYRKNRE